MKKILTILFVCFYSICLSQSTDSTKIFYTKEECKEIFLLTFEIIDNGTISEYPKEKMTKITNVLCDCFLMYNFISVESMVIKHHFKNERGVLLK